jgi:pilus assembly protein Flp/PilA
VSARIRRLCRTARDRGASAVEYGLMLAAIAATIVGVVFAVGKVVQGAFQETCASMAASPLGGDCPVPAGGGQVPPPEAPVPPAP